MHVLLVCTDAMKQASLFLPLTVNMLFVSMRKGWKRYFGDFADYHNVRIMSRCVIFELNKFAYVG